MDVAIFFHYSVNVAYLKLRGVDVLDIAYLLQMFLLYRKRKRVYNSTQMDGASPTLLGRP